MSSFPRWIDMTDEVNLREVAADLFVGASNAVMHPPNRAWHSVIDCHGPTRGGERRELAIRRISPCLRWSRQDGNPIPTGLLDVALSLYRTGRGPMLVSCSDGTSRSVAVACALVRVCYDMSHPAVADAVSSPRQRPAALTMESALQWAHWKRGR